MFIGSRLDLSLFTFYHLFLLSFPFDIIHETEAFSPLYDHAFVCAPHVAVMPFMAFVSCITSLYRFGTFVTVLGILFIRSFSPNRAFALEC